MAVLAGERPFITVLAGHQNEAETLFHITKSFIVNSLLCILYNLRAEFVQFVHKDSG